MTLLKDALPRFSALRTAHAAMSMVIVLTAIAVHPLMHALGMHLALPAVKAGFSCDSDSARIGGLSLPAALEVRAPPT